jgi:hypothetical protein
MRWLIWQLGRRFVFVRKLYYKLTKGKWLWGVYYALDMWRAETPDKWLDDNVGYADYGTFKKNLEEIFNYKGN